MADQKEKPGYMTTEFWGTLITSAIVMLTTTGVLSPEQGEGLAEAGNQLTAAILSGIGALVAGGLVLGYNNGRAKVKAASKAGDK